MIRNLRKNSVIMLSVLSLLPAITACKKDQQPAVSPPAAPAVAPVKPAKAAVQQQSTSAASMSSVPTTQFDFSTKKDPFKPHVVVKPPTIATPQDSRRVSHLPIHSFDVSQFKLIGIVSGGRENQAMVTDPNGKAYVLKVGMTIGKNDGRITAITNNGIEVREQFRDDNNRVRKENIKLTLPRKY